LWIFVWPPAVVTATFCACGTMAATLPRTSGSAGEPALAGRADGPAAGTLVPRKPTDGRQEAPRREAQFGSTRVVELKFVTSGTSLRSDRYLAHGHVGSLSVAP